MDSGSKDSPNVTEAASNDEVEATADETIGDSVASNTNTNALESISQVASKDVYRETEIEPESATDDEAEVERKFYKTSKALQPRRTYSASDSQVDDIPQIKIYDSDAKNEGEKWNSEQGQNLRVFPEASAVWGEIKGQCEQSESHRVTNSDGEFSNIKMYCSEMTKMNSMLSKLSLKRTSSTPPVCSSEIRQKHKDRFIKTIKHFFKSGSYSVSDSSTTGESSLAKSVLECAEIKSSSISTEDTSQQDPSSSRTSAGLSSENKEYRSRSNQTLSSDDETETSSESSDMYRTLDIKEKFTSSLENYSRVETSCSSSELERPREILNVPQGVSVPEKSSSTDTTGNSSETFDTRKAEKSKSPLHNLEIEDAGGSECSEVSRIIEDGKTMSLECIDCYSTTYTETTSSSDDLHKSSADIEIQKSPPRITSDPPSAAFKVPSITKRCSTQSDSSPSPTPEKPRSAPSSIRRPSDFNVKARSAFYTFNSSSPTGLVLRPSRSLPNINSLFRYNSIRRGINFNNLRSRVVRSLFTGNFNPSPESYRNGALKDLLLSKSSQVPDQTTDSETSNSSDDSPKNSADTEKHNFRNSSELPTSDNCPEVCPKITLTTPKGTNTDVILQENLSELIGDVTKLQLQDILLPEATTSTEKNEKIAKRRVDSPNDDTQCSPAKKPRSASESDLQAKSEKEEHSHVKTDLFKPEVPKENVSPKRKAEDLEDSGKPDDSSSDASKVESSKSTAKKAKVKSPTPEREADVIDCLPEPDKEPKIESKKSN